MDNRESGWRVQLSFLCSLLLHAGAIALIVLGPTFILNHGMNMGSKTPNANSQPVDLTIATPTPKPTVAPKPVIVKPSVVKPVAQIHKVRVVKIARKEIVHKPISPKPIARKIYAKKSPVIVAAKKPAALKNPPVVNKPVATVTQKPVPAVPQKPAAVATNKVAPKAVAVAKAPLGSPDSPIKVTQNYLGLRQMPGNMPPVYTRDMRLQHMQGSGQLVYYVNENGTVSDLHLTKSTGYPQLDEAAIQAFSKYRFYPGQEGYTVHNFEFVLQGPAVSEGGGLRTSMTGN